MAARGIVRTIAFIEVFIGIATILGLMISVLFSFSVKPPNVFIFVLISAVISSSLGIGIFRHNEKARVLLVFFSGYVLITKILIISGLMQLSNEMVTVVPFHFKNVISIIYHAFVVLFFASQGARKEFAK